MGTMVELDEASAEAARRLVDEGRFASVEDVVGEAMMVLRRQETERWLENLSEQADQQIAAGEYSSVDDVRGRLQKRSEVSGA
ncbi:hypothetical protein [Mongoliimonas terrestris]|uniref:hypothetical protein n=1 Tax=Mongoliimonas terrestris TaxID=1709001 RepID=UPI0009494E7A|nr:hypothetical protein [Mongoliimonas terrestris]